tara:strand:+ start:10816 stop:11025 length:210 start_codon:yes stop_codon:yes gene_type:complete
MEDNPNLKEKLTIYRKENMMLRDKLAFLKGVVIKEHKDEKAVLLEKIDKLQKEKAYWEHKHNKKGGWFW